eukprot:5483517-Ditylum_brightwellii.AAC.1
MVSGQQVVLCIVVGIVGIKAIYDVGVIPVCAYVWSWSWMGMREHTVGQGPVQRESGSCVPSQTASR